MNKGGTHLWRAEGYDVSACGEGFECKINSCILNGGGVGVR